MKMGIFDRLFKPNVERLREKKDVKGLIKALRHEDVRKEAAEALVNIGEPAVEPLIQALKDEYSDVREEAARALGRIGDKRAVEPLIQALKDNIDVQRRAAWALRKIGEPAVEPLIQALKDEYSDVRWRAAWALDEMGWEPGDDTEKVYYLIAKQEWSELPELGEPAVEPLIQALKDEYSDVRWRAAWALDEMGWEPGDDTEKVYYLIAKQEWSELPELGEPAVEPLIQALKDEYSDVRESAAEALAKIGEPAVEPLIQALKDEDWHVQEEAAEALGEIGDKRAVEPLIQALKDEDWHVQEEAAEALGEIGDKRAVEPLIQALKDEDWHVQEEAAEALGEIGDKRAVEPLIQALKDEDVEYVRAEAAGALVKIGDKRAVEAVIKYLFEDYSELYGLCHFIKKYSSSLINLFGDYTDLILKACSYRCIEISSDSYDYYLQEAITQEAITATKRLCDIRTPISSNILLLIAKKRDIETIISSQHIYISFESQRKIAKEELKRRGNPPYKPSTYLKKEAWKL